MQANVTNQYRIGGLVWELIGPDFTGNAHLEKFRVQGQQADHAVKILLADYPALSRLELLHRDTYTEYYGEGDRRERVVYLERKGTVLFSEKEASCGNRAVELARDGLDYYGTNLAMRILDIPYQILRHEGVFLHASYILVGGKAVLFTAPKQVGKSTQAALWEKYRGAEVINGDRAILRRLDGVWHACGSPYCGTSDICQNHRAPLGAVVVLGQAKENRVSRATVREAMAAFLNGCTYATWDRTQVETMMELAGQILAEVPVIKLDCVPDESAVGALEEFLWELEMK